MLIWKGSVYVNKASLEQVGKFLYPVRKFEMCVLIVIALWIYLLDL